MNFNGEFPILSFASSFIIFSKLFNLCSMELVFSFFRISLYSSCQYFACLIFAFRFVPIYTLAVMRVKGRMFEGQLSVLVMNKKE